MVGASLDEKAEDKHFTIASLPPWMLPSIATLINCRNLLLLSAKVYPSQDETCCPSMFQLCAQRHTRRSILRICITFTRSFPTHCLPVECFLCKHTKPRETGPLFLLRSCDKRHLGCGTIICYPGQTSGSQLLLCCPDLRGRRLPCGCRPSATPYQTPNPRSNPLENWWRASFPTVLTGHRKPRLSGMKTDAFR
jgi:hypothetical protein